MFEIVLFIVLGAFCYTAIILLTKAASLSPMIVQEDMIEKWDGKMPQIVGGNSMMFDISKIIGNNK